MFASSKNGIFKSAIINVCLRWTDRFIGLTSTLILARLLVPEDFGIIAMASLVINIADVFLNLGVNVALIQNNNLTSGHYNTAWTLRLLQTSLSTLLVVLLAPIAADYFQDDRVISVVRLMACGFLLVGLENIGVIDFQKNMQFGLEFRFLFFKRLAGFLVTIAAAALLHSYWALVAGALAGRFIGVILSYHMHSMRPKLSLEKYKEIFSVSQWMLVNSIGGYLNLNLHKILVGRNASSTIMGGYTLADEISAMPTGEVLAPINRVLFPAFVQVKNDLNELKRMFLLAQGIQTLIAIPVSVGLALVAHDAVAVFLGEKWLFAAPYLQLLAFASATQAITTSGSYVMLTVGAHRQAAIIYWAQLTFFITAIFILPTSGAFEIAAMRVLTASAGLILVLWMLMRALPVVRLGDMFIMILRPLSGAIVMTIIIMSINHAINVPPSVSLIIKVLSGLVVYPLTVLLMWWLAGRPIGAETYLLGKIAPLFGRYQKKC